MPETPLPPTQIVSHLTITIPRITDLIAGLSAAQGQTRPDAEAWSLHELVDHLRACNTVWGKMITRILTEDNPTIRYVSPRTWIRKAGYKEADVHEAFRAFAAERAALLAQLEPLPPEAWHRTATIKATKIQPRTVLYYADGMVRHEQAHLTQMEDVVAMIGQSLS